MSARIEKKYLRLRVERRERGLLLWFVPRLYVSIARRVSPSGCFLRYWFCGTWCVTNRWRWQITRSQGRRAVLQFLGWSIQLFLVLCLCSPAGAQLLSGGARVIDGDSLEIQGEKIRLHGIDAPELRQTCFRPRYSAAARIMGDAPWACGVSARRHLEELINKRPVTCRSLDRDRYGRIIARCFVGSPHIDLGGWMVRYGHAVAYLKYSRDYLPQESVARGDGLGIWAGTFMPPDEWRKRKR